MFIIRLFRFLRGYVIVLVRGGFGERFLNLAVRKNIDFWNVVRKDGQLTLCIKKADFKKIRDIAKMAACQVSITKKTGAPFLLFRYRKRTVLFSGFIIFAIALWVLSLFLWSVDIVADDGLDAGRIMQSLEAHGIKSGARLSAIRSEEVKNTMMMEFSDIAFIGINIKGTRAQIEVKKRDPVPNIVPRDQPCNIVATKTGQIIYIEAREGAAQVMAGQGVEEGELLVSGVLDSQIVGARYVHAQAQVMAKTWYTYEEEGWLEQTIRERTGETKSRYRLRIFDLGINLYIKSGNPYDIYDKMMLEAQARITGDILLPVWLEEERFLEVEEVLVRQTLEEARAEAEAKCDAAFLQSAGEVLVVDKKRTVTNLEDRVLVRMEYECEEDIARKEPIQLSLEEARTWRNSQS